MTHSYGICFTLETDLAIIGAYKVNPRNLVLKKLRLALSSILYRYRQKESYITWLFCGKAPCIIYLS